MAIRLHGATAGGTVVPGGVLARYGRGRSMGIASWFYGGTGGQQQPVNNGNGNGNGNGGGVERDVPQAATPNPPWNLAAAIARGGSIVSDDGQTVTVIFYPPGFPAMTRSFSKASGLEIPGTANTNSADPLGTATTAAPGANATTTATPPGPNASATGEPVGVGSAPAATATTPATTAATAAPAATAATTSSTKLTTLPNTSTEPGVTAPPVQPSPVEPPPLGVSATAPTEPGSTPTLNESSTPASTGPDEPAATTTSAPGDTTGPTTLYDLYTSPPPTTPLTPETIAALQSVPVPESIAAMLTPGDVTTPDTQVVPPPPMGDSGTSLADANGTTALAA